MRFFSKTHNKRTGANYARWICEFFSVVRLLMLGIFQLLVSAAFLLVFEDLCSSYAFRLDLCWSRSPARPVRNDLSSFTASPLTVVVVVLLLFSHIN